RPDKKKDLKRLIKGGRIYVGPWYTLPDMCSIGGEPIIRNLLFGHKLANEFGKVMKAGYTPTGFGQISQLPQIYAGFDIDTVMFYRGADRDAVKKEFLWEASDGSRSYTYIFTPEYGRMPLFHCIASKYYRGRNFYERDCIWDAGEGAFRLNDDRTWKDMYYQSQPLELSDVTGLKENIKSLVEVEMKHSSMDTFLLVDGVDSTEPQPLVTKLINEMNNAVVDVVFYHSNMEDFVQKLKGFESWSEVYRGEMRSSAREGAQVNLMGSAISSRIYLKQLNDRYEKALIHWSEPFSTFAWLLGVRYPEAYIEKAWKYLLWNQSHDSIAGCSMDIVHQDMEYYFRQCGEITDAVIGNSLFHIVSNLSGKGVNDNGILVVVFNPLPFNRSEVVRTFVDIPAAYNYRNIKVTDFGGQNCACQIHGLDENHRTLVHRPKDVPGIYSMHRWDLTFSAENVPACGYKAFFIENTGIIAHGKYSAGTHGSVICNEYLSVSINTDGTFNVMDLSGNEYKGLNRFADNGEAGDPWISRKPENDFVIEKPEDKPGVWVATGELYSSITVSLKLAVPEESNSLWRNDKMDLLEIETTAVLEKGKPWLHFTTRVKNTARDHRLRVLFPTGTHADYSFAEMPFDIMKRDIKPKDTESWFEKGYTTHPQRGFSAVTDGKKGLAILNKGLPEYEAIDDMERTIAITLLRCHKMFVPKLKTVDISQEGGQCL
ncbi:MAG: glycoside hydrolase family 38 C-terminal domain-containing protein, partial [Clostridiales bacterium]|nr:glycoside hydrolase family 38 C-terminal domain-containing protein [Clostridiales bacterium]